MKGRIMHLKLLIALILTTMLTAAHQEGDTKDSSTEMDQQWTNFKVKFGKTYETVSEEILRKKIFMEKLKEIKAHNKLYSEGLTSYTTGINQFSDMEYSEFTETTGCINVADIEVNSTMASFDPISKELPTEVDWRTKGHVTGVKNQGYDCGSCWAFAATGSLEALMARTTGKLVSLSEQNLIDCSFEYGNDGCDGGQSQFAFQYVSDNEGINSEASYPYEEINSTCRYQSNDVAGRCDYFFEIVGESDLQAAVATIGPIVIYIHASDSFKDYYMDIYDNETGCLGPLTHAMLIVGYGTDVLTGKDYWIIKNSWGTDWGTDGYAYVVRNKEMCGIGLEATYPVLYNEQLASTTTTVLGSRSSHESASLIYILLLQLLIAFSNRPTK